MSTHISDELPLLLTGEATHQAVLDAAVHLRECPDCQEELIAAVVAHASLSSAHRFAPEIVARDAETWEPRTDDSLPDLTQLFEQARAESAETAGTEQTDAPVSLAARRRRRQPWLVAAAAAVVLAGGGIATTVAVTQHSSSPATRSVALAAYDVGRSPAEATLATNGRVTIDASRLPHVTGQRYEVWLTDRHRTQMQPIGWIGSNGTATLTVPTDLMGTYSYIEVSRQNVSSPSYVYSGVSVLRGRYTA